jgi:hypothetical protein
MISVFTIAHPLHDPANSSEHLEGKAVQVWLA